jgi:translin
MFLQKKYIQRLKKNTLSHASLRRDVIKDAGDALHFAKRAIFAMHRDDMKEAEQKLGQSRTIFLACEKRYKKQPEMKNEGAYRAALEEYVEAVVLHQFLTKRKIDEVKEFVIAPDVYIAGLADVPGELLRYATKAATAKDENMVQGCLEAAQEIVGELIEFNLTRYLRTKFDQAKSAVRKFEYVAYELSLRK